MTPLLVVAGTGCRDKARAFCDNAVEYGPYVDANGFTRCMERYRAASPAERACFEGCKDSPSRCQFDFCERRCKGEMRGEEVYGTYDFNRTEGGAAVHGSEEAGR